MICKLLASIPEFIRGALRTVTKVQSQQTLYPSASLP